MGRANWRARANLAMRDAWVFGYYALFCRALCDLIDYAGPSKVLFGTDKTAFSLLESTNACVQLIHGLPEKALAAIQFTREEDTGIVGENTAVLLGLS